MRRNEICEAGKNTCGVSVAAVYFGVSPATMRRLAESGEIGHLRVGRRRTFKFRPEDIAEYERRIEVAAPKNDR